MSSKRTRIAVAAGISVLGIALTQTWYNMTDPRKANEDAAAVAFVKKPIDEIHRRSAESFLWQLVEDNEPLHNGDSIRTSSQGEVRIQFAQSSKYLDLEPESSIVIQQKDGEISLDLLEGSLFVAGGEAEGSPSDGSIPISINSGGTKVDISKAKAKLSGSSKSGLDFNIIEGSAKTNKNGKGEKLTAGRSVTVNAAGMKNRSDAIKIINPQPDGTIYQNPEMPIPVSFRWDGPTQGMNMQLEIGSSRKNMKAVAAKTGKSAFELQYLLSSGKYFWKLKGKDTRTGQVALESSVYHLEVADRTPPVAVFPKADSKIIVSKIEEGMELRWSSDNFSRIKIEVYTTGPNGKVVFVDSYPASASSTVIHTLPFGEYEWKLYGQTDKGESMAGPRVPFRFARKDPTRVNLAWSSEFSNTQRYINNDPKISLKWTTDKSSVVAKYKIKITPEGQPQSMQVFETRSGEFSQPLKTQGRYIASIEAINKDEEIIGSMTPRTIEVAPVPPLKGLTILPADASKLMAKSDGNLTVQWRALSGAKEYKIVLKNSSGNTIKEDVAGDDNYSFRSLLPGEYTVQLTPFDDFGRAGEPTRPRAINVPEKSQIKAPKLKAIKVK